MEEVADTVEKVGLVDLELEIMALTDIWAVEAVVGEDTAQTNAGNSGAGYGAGGGGYSSTASYDGGGGGGGYGLYPESTRGKVDGTSGVCIVTYTVNEVIVN